MRQELKIDEWYEHNLDRMPSHRSARGGTTSRSGATSVNTGVGGSQKQPYFMFKSKSIGEFRQHDDKSPSLLRTERNID